MTRWFLCSLGLVLGCRSSSGGEVPREERPFEEVAAGEGAEPAGEEEAAWSAIGFGLNGKLLVFDALTGTVTSAAEGGGGIPRDVAVDEAAGRVWVLEENEDGSGGEIRVCPFSEGSVGPCAHAAWVDGGAALWASEAGLWVFEASTYGPRWKVLREGEAAKGVYAPPPASVWANGDRIEALSYGVDGESLGFLSARWTENGISVTEGLALGAPGIVPATARFVQTSSEAGLLWDIAAGDLVVRRVHDGIVEPAQSLGVGAGIERIEAAAMLGDAAVVVSTNTTWFVTFSGEDGVGAVMAMDLEGDVRRAFGFLSRDLAVAGQRALVGTDRGVRAFVVEKSGAVVVDGGFDGEGLRGPLVALRSSR